MKTKYITCAGIKKSDRKPSEHGMKTTGKLGTGALTYYAGRNAAGKPIYCTIPE
jgi:hypothetical protein